MVSTISATRAQLFMRQCRCSRIQSTGLSLNLTPPKRTVSSSHLAPANFSKPLRLRVEISSNNDTSSYLRDRRSPLPPSLPTSHPSVLPSPSITSQQRTSPFTNAGQRFPRAPAITTAPPIPPGFLNFIKHRILNIPPPRPKHKPPPFTAINNPYKARKQWPPDFRNLHPKQQFHFEKTFRRRAVIKAHGQRYNWNRYVKLVQQSLIVLTVVYFLFIADPYHKEGGGTPVDGFRAWFFGQFAKNEHIPAHLRSHAEELQSYYSKNADRNTHEIAEVTQKARDANMASSQAVLEARGKVMKTSGL